MIKGEVRVPWHKRLLEGVIKDLSTSAIQGLSLEDVQERQLAYGRNELPKAKKLKWWHLFSRQFINPLVLILLGAGIVTYALREYIDFTVILLAVFVNVLIGFWQEYRSSELFEKLRQLVRINARVVRNGKIREVDASELVPGDIVILKGDMKVPADARLLESRNLFMSEAVLTGESSAVEKQAIELTGDLPLGDRKNMVYMGTIVERGEARAIVVGTGAKTEFGNITLLTTGVKEGKTPLQSRLSYLGKIIALFSILFSIIIFLVGTIENHTWKEMFTVAVAVAVASIPEGLPAALSVVLAVSAKRILQKKGLVKRLIGAETLGSTSVIVTDKTGTLTEGKMEVEELFAAEDKDKAALIMALANDALVEIDGIAKVKITGEATDKAKIQYFLDHGGNYEAAMQEYPRRAILNFSDDKKYIASFHNFKGGQAHLFVAGAPEALLALSKIDDYRKIIILRQVEERAARGFRMIGIAERVIDGGMDILADDEKRLYELVHDLSFVGIAAIRDPIRSDAGEAVMITRRAGVRIIMLTGDHQFTARAIGKELGFASEQFSLVSGNEIDAMTDEELAQRIGRIDIFARVSPVHKLRVIQILKKKGEVVAMTGDGVNDAPALRAADIGISLGSGTDVTKEAADIVLIDDSFSVITAAIREGRIAFENIRKVAVFLLANSFTEILLVLTALVFRIPLPLTAVMILWANLVEDSFPNFALAFEPGEPDVMNRKPIRKNEKILDRQGLFIIFVVGIISDLFLVGLFLYLYYTSGGTAAELRHIRTLIFALLATDALFEVFAIKSYHSSIFHINIFSNHFLLFSAAFGFIMLLVSVYAPPLQKVLGTVSLSWKEIVLILGIGIIQLLMIECAKWFFRKSEYASPRMVRTL